MKDQDLNVRDLHTTYELSCNFQDMSGKEVEMFSCSLKNTCTIINKVRVEGYF